MALKAPREVPLNGERSLCNEMLVPFVFDHIKEFLEVPYRFQSGKGPFKWG
jgi:hypothetical protein